MAAHTVAGWLPLLLPETDVRAWLRRHQFQHGDLLSVFDRDWVLIQDPDVFTHLLARNPTHGEAAR
jgi:hypothetical protein